MQTNRRIWLKQIGLGAAGIGLSQLKTFASPAFDFPNFAPGDGTIRLSSNENPYGPSPLARVAMINNINISNRYNWQLGSDLVEALAKKNNVNADNILLGAGST